MKILASEFESNFILENEHGKFHPMYTFDDFVFNKEFEEYEYVGLVVTKTAEQMYLDWLENKDKIHLKQQTEEQKLLTEIIISML